MNNPKNMNEILLELSKNGIDKEKIKNGNVEDIVASLSGEQQQKLNNILSDKSKTEQILSSPAARQLIKALLGDKNG